MRLSFVLHDILLVDIQIPAIPLMWLNKILDTNLLNQRINLSFHFAWKVEQTIFLLP